MPERAAPGALRGPRHDDRMTTEWLLLRLAKYRHVELSLSVPFPGNGGEKEHLPYDIPIRCSNTCRNENAMHRTAAQVAVSPSPARNLRIDTFRIGNSAALASDEPFVVCYNVQKAYGPKEVLRGIDLEIKRGEVVVLMGPSGSGKSRLLRLVNHLEPLDWGQIANMWAMKRARVAACARPAILLKHGPTSVSAWCFKILMTNRNPRPMGVVIA